MKYLVVMALLCHAIGAACASELKQSRFPAQVYSKHNYVLSVELFGTLEMVLDEGAKFKKGDTVFRLDTSLEQAQLKAYQQLELLTQDQLAINRTIFANYKQMHERKALSEDLLSEKELSVINSEIQRTRNSVDIAQMRSAIKRKQFIAPFDGVVLERLSSPREVVQQGKKVVRILKDNDLYLKVKLPVSSLSNYALGKASVINGHLSLPIELDYVSQQVDKQTNTVEVSYALPDAPFRVNETVMITMPLNKEV
ncbi:efflux RND transporter periplasmic adaptor subunit [Pseudoalteromonas rubra]|uniref:efflux RND transporter periplasmic adaptor subunit n=1 Tax=Pseudoalteromonas rubra TaxID=43658 RepID=UPI000F786375|nr:HlyD family efflux transporter periplasmic adaptor subunit [Pseudoalteromonas rubra]